MVGLLNKLHTPWRSNSIKSSFAPTPGPAPIHLQSKQIEQISTALNTTLTHLKFNTIVPNGMVNKLFDLGLSQYMFTWIEDILPHR